MSPVKRVVSDTGPIISLEKLTGGFQFICKLYDEVIIPTAVLEELAHGEFESGEAYLSHYHAADILTIKRVSSFDLQTETSHLDEGERQAIQLAFNEELPLLIEEHAGRETAQKLGLHISGIAGQLNKAFQQDLITAEEAKEKLDELLIAGRINTKVHEIVAKTMEKQ